MEYRSFTLQFALVFDSVTIATSFVTKEGQQVSATELFHMDGREHPGTLNPGVSLTGKWVHLRRIDTGGKKDGCDVGTVSYEISSDGRTLTQSYSLAPEQRIVFRRK